MMKSKTFFRRSTTLVALALLCSANIFSLPSGETANPTVTVIGEGTVEAVPDRARVRIGVESYNNDIQKALAESRSIIAAVFDTLLELGIAEKDMQTANYSFYFDRSSASDPGIARGTVSTKPVYRVNNTLTVTIRDLNLTGQIIDAAVLAGANEMWGVEFFIQEPGPLLGEATKLAVSQAFQRAKHLASLNRLSVGKLLSISENTTTPSFALMERGLGGGVHPGVVTYSVQLTAVYQLTE